MNWSDLAPIIAKAAPLLGSALGPIGTIAGGAVGAIISSVTGTPADSPDAAAAAIAADPTLLEKLREAELANQATLAQVALQQRQAELAAQTAADAQRTSQYQAEAADRDSARKLASQQPKDFMRPLLSLAIVAATIAVVFIVLLGFADGTLRDPVIAATAGGLVMYFLKESSQVTGFWFGMTREATVANADVRAFAVSPGSVTDVPILPATAKPHPLEATLQDTTFKGQ
jgi:hypothetical protein